MHDNAGVLRRWGVPLSFVMLLALWQASAWLWSSPVWPGPWQVGVVLLRELQSGALPYHLAVTLGRLAISFLVAILLGSALGIALGRLPRLDAFFDPWLVVFLNVPALVTIILCYVWLGLNEAAAILAVVINKVPNVAVTLREGARALDRDLLDMARCYRLGWRKTLRHVVLPQLHPYWMAATRSGLALIWKIILVVELLGRSSGMGYQLHLFFQLFDVAGILAYTVAFIAVMHSIEKLLLRPLDRHGQRWRR